MFGSAAGPPTRPEPPHSPHIRRRGRESPPVSRTAVSLRELTSFHPRPRQAGHDTSTSTDSAPMQPTIRSTAPLRPWPGHPGLGPGTLRFCAHTPGCRRRTCGGPARRAHIRADPPAGLRLDRPGGAGRLPDAARERTVPVETLRRWQAIASALNMPDQPRALIGLAPQQAQGGSEVTSLGDPVRAPTPRVYAAGEMPEDLGRRHATA
jgi:hypothetical protein